jgi:serine protease Do
VTLFLTICLLATSGAGLPAQTFAQSEGAIEAQRQPTESRGRRRGGRNLEFLGEGKSHATVLEAFQPATTKAAAATVQVLVDDKVVALGTIVDPGGLVVSKASLLDGDLKCRTGDQQEFAAEIAGILEEHDLALLRIDAQSLTAVTWRTGKPPAPGTLVAAPDADGKLLAVGVISAAPRPVPGVRVTGESRGWLGIELGGGDSGLAISSVVRRSAAEEAGLKAGDRVAQIDGQRVEQVRQVIEAVGSHPPGETIEIVVVRDGEELKKSATLGKPEDRPSPQDRWGGGPFSKRRSGFPTVIPHDTLVRPEQCGGPLVDTDGAVVGINIARALRVATYALPAETVREAVEALRQETAADR